MDFEQISTQKTPGPETKTTTTKIKKKYTREKTLFSKHHLEIYLWRRVAFSWIPVWLYWAAAQLPRLLRWPHWLIIYPLFVEFWQSVKWELGKCSNNSNADLNVLQDKMPEVKEKPREKGNYELCCLAWNPHLQRRWREKLGCTREETANIPPPFEKCNYASEKHKVRDEAYWGTVQQLWLVFMYKGWEGGSTRDRQRDHTSVAPQYSSTTVQDAPVGPAPTVAGSNPTGTCWQQRIWSCSIRIPAAYTSWQHTHTSQQHGALLSLGQAHTTLRCSKLGPAWLPMSRPLLVPVTFLMKKKKKKTKI